MTQFTPGQRVAAYQGTDRYTGKVTHASETRVSIVLDTPTYAGAKYLGVHPKQCRKLVKKERMRLWVDFLKNSDGTLLVSNAVTSPVRGMKEFVEVRKREKK